MLACYFHTPGTLGSTCLIQTLESSLISDLTAQQSLSAIDHSIIVGKPIMFD
jgi:hypothetical protein